MLARKKRIRKSKEIELVLKKGESFRRDSLVLKILKNDLGFSRFAFLVSKKVSKKANVRNKIKRRLREIVRLKADGGRIGSDNIIIALPGLEKKEFGEVEKIIEELFKKQKK